jgi:hypothetical protein
MKRSQTIFSMISSKPAHHARQSSPRNSQHAAESRLQSALRIWTGSKVEIRMSKSETNPNYQSSNSQIAS